MTVRDATHLHAAADFEHAILGTHVHNLDPHLLATVIMSSLVSMEAITNSHAYLLDVL